MFDIEQTVITTLDSIPIKSYDQALGGKLRVRGRLNSLNGPGAGLVITENLPPEVFL